MKLPSLLTACLCIVGSSAVPGRAAIQDVEPDAFVGGDSLLDQNELRRYHINRENLSPDEPLTDSRVMVWLGDLRDHLKKEPPYTPDEVRRGENRTKDDVQRLEITGILRRSLTNAPFGEKWGPFRIRKNVDDWNKGLNDVSGASISYQKDWIEKAHTWSSEGALIYPILLTSASDRPGTAYSSSELWIFPAATWKVSEISNKTNDVEDLQFQFPISFGGNRRSFAGWHPSAPWQWRDELTLSPFFHTDFHGEGKIVGGILNYEALFQFGNFEVGQWHSIGGTKVAYLFRARPKLEFSKVLQGSRFIDRPKGDEWIRGGATLDFGLRPFGKNAPWEIKSSYSSLYNFNGGKDAYSDLFEAKTTYWFNDNVGLSFSFQKGETPISDKAIKLLTLGLEVKL
jgi:hypothetical protein